jgi:hypothetical protein
MFNYQKEMKLFNLLTNLVFPISEVYYEVHLRSLLLLYDYYNARIALATTDYHFPFFRLALLPELEPQYIKKILYSRLIELHVRP